MTRGVALVRRIVGVALMVDGLASALWLTTLLGSLSMRDAVSVAAIVTRVVAGALAVTAGWLVTQQRPPGVRLAVVSASLTALVVTAGTWWGWLPTNLDPVWRQPVAGAYWVAAIAIAVWARRRMPDGELM